VITGLKAPLDQAVWVVNAYLMVFCAPLIVASRLGDMFGPRRMFTAGLALFALASALCGAAQTPGQLIAARALQGIGAAALAPQAFVIIQAIFPRDRLGAVYGVISSMVGVAAVCGPTLGGVLTTELSWRWVFYANLPIAAAGITLAYQYVPEIRTGRRHRLDLTGGVQPGQRDHEAGQREHERAADQVGQERQRCSAANSVRSPSERNFAAWSSAIFRSCLRRAT
jgi:MFS family permease